MAGASENVAIQDEKPEPSKADSFAEGIIKGLQDFKEGRIARLKDADELAIHLCNLQVVMAFRPVTTNYFERKFRGY